MTQSSQSKDLRCPRCGHEAATRDKFCAECGRFLRDAYFDQRLGDARTAAREFGRAEKVGV